MRFCPAGGSGRQITANMIRSGVSGTFLSACQGDSGGPYFCQNSAGNWVACEQAHLEAQACAGPLHQTPSRRIALLFVARARDSEVSLLTG